ncbi:MAG: hypothetical protein AAFX50_09815 [Acidobacteriota bacterium]
MWRRGVIAGLLGLLAGAASAAAEVPAEAATAPRVEIDHRGVRVVGLGAADLLRASRLGPPTSAWRDVLRITAVDPDLATHPDTAADSARSTADPTTDLPPLLGAYDVDPELGALRFRPRFAPAPGLVLHARFDGAAWARLVGGASDPGILSARFVVPEPEARERARVLSVTPSGDVPANLLRLYVHFSEPMSARHVLDHVELLDPSGRPVDDAFVEVPGGLWDQRRTRLTLFVHPGRVKRGVGPNQAQGPVFEAGGRYRLRVAASAKDAVGRALAKAYEATLLVGPADRRSPDPSAWRVVAPPDPAAPLVVELDEPVDAALVARLLEVEGRAVRVRVDADGRRARLEPESPWTSGRYRLLVPVALEDPSGNRVDRLFEEAPAEAGAEDGPPVALEFTLRF